MCLYPKLLKNRKYTKTKKNKGIVPQVNDARVLMVPVGCGKCMECRKQRAREWQVRLSEELRHDNEVQFVTLTFNDEGLEELEELALQVKVRTGVRKEIVMKNGKTRKYYNYDIKKAGDLYGYDLDNEIAKRGTRRFLENWRKRFGKSCKHWLVTELGQKNTERIHMHGFMWTNEVEAIKELWKYGNVYIGDWVNEATVNYTVKYLSKQDELHKEYKGIILTSAGIGKGYLDRFDSKNNKFKGDKTNEAYVTRTGVKLALPIYYRNNLYSDEEREELWIDKLDKEVRFVNGNKVDISEGDEGYFKLLEEAKQKNKRLGYGDDTVNWDRKKYEQQRRLLIKRGKIGL